MEKVYIILINYNNFEITKECIGSIMNIDYPCYQIIVVDNGSTDNSYTLLTSEYSDNEKVTILKSDENLGFSGGNNIAIKYAIEQGGRFFLLLNNDTEVEPDFLSVMMSKCEDDTAVAPLIYLYDQPDKVWYGGGFFKRYITKVLNRRPKKERLVNFASGCCVLLTKHIIDTVGLLDEDFFMYCEDVDYSLRIYEKGCKILYTPDAVIYHKFGKTSNKVSSKLSVYYLNRNRFYLIKKYKLGFVSIVYTCATRLVRYLMSYIVKSNDDIILRAYRDFRRGKVGKWEQE